MRLVARIGPKASVGIVIIGAVAVLAIFAPLIAPYGSEQVLGAVLQPPSWDHPFGTDPRGMDIFSRTVFAPRQDLTIGLVATLFAFAIGVPLGALAGMYEGRGRIGGGMSQLIMRGMDVLQSFPVFVFALALVAVLGPGATNLTLGLVFVNAPVFVRQVRTSVLIQRDAAFVEAAVVAGWGRLRIGFRHVLPNALGPSVAQLSVTLGFTILLTAGLSFVGAGVRLPTAEWGVMISDGAGQMATGQWWPSVFPGASLAITVIGFSLIGEGLRESMEERGSRLAFRSARGMHRALLDAAAARRS